MALFKLKKERPVHFPSLLDSLRLYKDAIINSVVREDLPTASINFTKLISILEYHNQKENRLNTELEEAKKRYQVFQQQSESTSPTILF